MTLENKDYFMNNFVYKYLEDYQFRKNTKNKVLVFEASTYIGYTDENNIYNIGNSDKMKNTVDIGELPQVNLFGVKYTNRYTTELLNNDEVRDFKIQNHFLI